MKDGDYVLVKSATIDGLVQAFGDEGDGDFWDKSDWTHQKKYVGKIGIVEQVEETPYMGTFVVVKFTNGRMFTYSIYDLELSPNAVGKPTPD